MSKPKSDKSTRPKKDLKKADSMHGRAESALCEIEKLYTTLTENIAVGIFRTTPGSKGRLIEANPAMVKLFGFKNMDDLLARDVAEFYQNPADRIKYSEKISEKGFVQNEELHLKKQNGTPMIVSETSIAVKDEKGNIEYFYGIMEDITERKAAEEELQLQKTYLEKLFNNAPEAIALHDNNDLVVDVNDEFVKVFGYFREEAIGKPINDLLASEEFLNEAVSLSRKVIAGERVEMDTKRKRKDGTLIDVWILGAPIVHEGRQLGDYAIYRDMTERKKAQEELYIQKTYLERLFNSAPEAIVLHNNEDIIINVNDEFTKLFGYSREESIGKPINELVASDDFQEEASSLSQKVIHGERVEIDTRRKRKDGTLFDVWILGAPIIHEGRQMGVYAIYRDITERKKAEEARIRVKEEARLARDIQMNLLPKTNPDIPGYDIAGMSIPAENVGGDYYDFIHLDEHRLSIGLGDVSGKGMAAALVMANLQATIRGQSMFDGNTNECLERANKLLFRSTDAKTFVSLFYGILDTRNHALSYANAGQNTPLVFSGDVTPVQLQTHGLALGMREDASYRKGEILIQPGDRLLIYSDGIIEAMNERMEEFGDNKLREIVRRHNGSSAQELIERIITAVNLHSGEASLRDDMTIVLLVRRGTENSSVE